MDSRNSSYSRLLLSLLLSTVSKPSKVYTTQMGHWNYLD
jgi:hypothetical protein